MALPNHPCSENVLDHLRSAGPNGLPASLLLVLIDGVRPVPPGIVLLRELVDAGLIQAAPTPVTVESRLMLTEQGEAELAAARSAGAWLCEGTAAGRGALGEPSVVDFLRRIEQGDVVLTPALDPSEVYAGVVEYSASNGWRMAVFNDCNVWDYVEWIDADGQRLTYEDIDREMPTVREYQPSSDVAEQRYRIPRVTTRRVAPPQDLDADQRAFDQLREVLDGRRRLRLDAASSKMLRIILGGGDTDTVLTPDRFVVHFGTEKQRRPSEYHRRLAPRVMSELLERGALEAIREPVVIGLPGEDVPEVSGFPSWSYEPKLVWVVAADDAVRVVVRTSHEPWREPFVRVIPVEGPLAMRELPDWSPTAPVYRELDTVLPCPRCGVGSTCYRQLRDALVCPHCGRSFGFVG